MEEDPILREKAEKILRATEAEYGFVPVVNQVLSERPDMFVPSAEFSRAVMHRGVMDPKMKHLCAIAAATAVAGQYCIGVQMKHAREAGATRDEILESMAIGSMMAMTRSQSYAFRCFAEEFDIGLE